jgi:hypothetical protein
MAVGESGDAQEFGDELSVEEVAASLFDLLPDGKSENEGDDESQDVDEDDTDDVDEDAIADADDEAGEDEDEDDEPVDEVDEDEADEDEEEEKPPLKPVKKFRVKVAGEEEEVTLDELKQGYSRQSDYTRKTQKLSEREKELERDAAEARTARDEYGKSLAELKQGLKVKEPDWDKLREDDPEDYLLQRDAWNRRQDAIREVEAEQQKVAAEKDADDKKGFAKWQQDEAKKVFAALPSWKDQKVARAEMEKIAKFSQSRGFSLQELSMADARAVLLIREAMLYNEKIENGKSKLKGKVKQKTKVLAPGNPKSKQQTKTKAQDARRQRLKKSGSLQDAAASFMDDLD